MGVKVFDPVMGWEQGRIGRVKTGAVAPPLARLAVLTRPLRPCFGLASDRRSGMRVRLLPGDLPFPLCYDMREEGGTDYYAQALPFTNGQVSYVSAPR